MRIERQWHTDPVSEGLTLRMTAHIGGEVYTVDHTENYRSYDPSPPHADIERSMRSQIMRAIENRLFKEPQ